SVREIQVKQQQAASNWIWGAFKMPGQVLGDLHRLWLARNCRDEYIGTLVNAYLAAGGSAVGIKAGRAYVDVGTLHGYRAAMSLLDGASRAAGADGGHLSVGWPGGCTLDQLRAREERGTLL